MQLKELDKQIVNIINSSSHEYLDDGFSMDSIDVYWSFSAIRRNSFSFYPFSKEEDMLVVGDRYGALTGIACEKAGQVDAIVPTQLHADTLRKRYRDRDNLHIFVKPYDDWNMDRQYSYVLVNLEYAAEYDCYDSIEFDRLVEPAIKHLKDKGHLLLTSYGDRKEIIHKLLYKLGFKYQQYYDPLNNGALFIDAAREDILKKYEMTDTLALLQDKWIRKHNYPIMGEEVYDQDHACIDSVKKVQIDLLRKLLDVCESHDLKVYPIYGTLLGIIRDGGMIPGDDDIDVALMREDYDKLLQLTGEFQGKYFLQTPYVDDCFFGGYSKLRNSATTAINPQNHFVECNEGISIDIFPIDRAYTRKGKEKRKLRTIRMLQRLLYAKSYGYFKQFRDMKMLEWKAYRYAGKLIERNKMLDMLYAQMRGYDEGSNKGAIYCHYQNGELKPVYMNLSSFNKTTSLLYEGVSLNVPDGWEELLKARYGEGYMNSLEFMEWKKRHGYYDVNVPYTVYKKRFAGLKYPGSIKESIVLIGDGSLFNPCLKYYKDRVHVSHLVQFPDEKTIKSVMGIKVYRWEEFLNMNLEESKYRFVICSGDAREGERIMRQAGFRNYYIFWENRDWMLYANQSFVWKEIRENFK